MFQVPGQLKKKNTAVTLPSNYKTCLCQNYHYGSTCNSSSNNVHENMDDVLESNTRNVGNTGCPFGPKCHYIHNEILIEINIKRIVSY